MSKVICDVCGTSFPDTATQCPICGCVRNADTVPADGAASKKNNSYTYVKGGRFSTNNVRKRNKTTGTVKVNVVSDARKTKKPVKKGSNTPLIITAAVLVLAIIAVALYITLRFFIPMYAGQTEPSEITTEPIVTEAPTVPCISVKLDPGSIQLDEQGQSVTITANILPADTTDEVEFVVANSEIATLVQTGKSAVVTAMKPGNTVITVKCGDIKAICNVTCEFEISEEDATDPTAVTIPEGAELELNRNDFTMSYVGETWKLYTGNIPMEAITWTVGNTSVATVENGVVKAVGNGMTTVTAKCGDQEVSCIVRCDFSTSNQGIAGSGGGISEDG